MRHLASCLIGVVVVGCSGGDDGPPRLGKRTDPAALTTALDAIAGLDSSAIGRVLAEDVHTRCGPSCACLRALLDDTVDPCPAANASVPGHWPPMELAGRYLAEQVEDSKPTQRDRLLAALEQVRVPIPRVDATRWSLPVASVSRPLSSTRALVGLDRDSALWVGPMPIARFGALGARVEDAPDGIVGAPTQPDELGAAIDRVTGRSAPDPATAPATDLVGDDDWTIGTGGYGTLGGGFGYGGPETRRAMVAGEAGLTLTEDAPIVAADAAATALQLVEALAERGGAVAIRTQDTVAELPITFGAGHGLTDDATYMLTRSAHELYLGSAAAPQRWPIANGRYDVASVKAALRRATTSSTNVVAVMMEEATAADLVDTLALVLETGVRRVRITASQTYDRPRAARASSVPTISLGQPSAAGDLDKAIIRRYIKRNIAKLTYCYEKELLAKPTLEGTVQTQFFIDPRGQVAAASATGVDPDVAACVAAVLKGIEFPKPSGGGGVQVNYPFTFRPA